MTNGTNGIILELLSWITLFFLLLWFSTLVLTPIGKSKEDINDCQLGGNRSSDSRHFWCSDSRHCQDINLSLFESELLQTIFITSSFWEVIEFLDWSVFECPSSLVPIDPPGLLVLKWRHLGKDDLTRNPCRCHRMCLCGFFENMWSTVASEEKGPWFEPHLTQGPLCGVYMFSPCISGFLPVLRLPPTYKTHGLIPLSVPWLKQWSLSVCVSDPCVQKQMCCDMLWEQVLCEVQIGCCGIT